MREPTTGYLMTKPFETQCPMPGAFKSDSSYLDAMLKPVVRPKGGAAPGAAAKGGGGAAAGPSEAAPASAEAFGKANLQVAKVLSAAKHPESEKLYVCKIQVAGGQKQVVAGLQKFVAQADLEGALVCAIVNLRPAKLAGTKSEAMILAASQEDAGSPEGRAVEVLAPPAGAAAGDRIYLEGAAGPPEAPPPKKLSSAIWGAVQPRLAVRGGKACFGATAMVTAAGAVTSALPDGSTIS